MRASREWYNDVNNCKEAAQELAEELGVEIKGSYPINFWFLPILEALADKIKKLEE